MPCILVTKKRYVGQSYNPDVISQIQEKLLSRQKFFQDIPTYIDAKGIESIRKDCPLITRRAVTGVIQALFANNDLSECNTYLTKLFLRYCLGYFPSMDDFVFIKRTRIGYSSSDLSVANKTAGIASNIQAYPLLPEYGECVEYVVVGSGCGIVSGAYPVHQLYKFNKYGALPYNVYYAYYLSKYVISPVQRMTVLAGFSAEDVMLRVGTFLLHNSKIVKNYTK